MARISRLPVSKLNQRPRVLVMPSLMPSSVCADGPPRQTRMSGSASSICRQDERQADLRLLRRRRAVAGRPPRHDVGDVDHGAVEADRRQHAVEQFAGAADEGQALDVFVAAGRFADEHHARPWVAVGEHQLRRGRFQRAAVEFVENGAQLVERLGAFGRFARRHGGFVGRLRAAGGPARPLVSRSGGERDRLRRADGRRGRFGAQSDRPAARPPGRRRRLPVEVEQVARRFVAGGRHGCTLAWQPRDCPRCAKVEYRERGDRSWPTCPPARRWNSTW